jgi:hypothetical protein
MADREVRATLNWQVKGHTEAVKAVADLDARLKAVRVERLTKEFQQVKEKMLELKGAMRVLTGDEFKRTELEAIRLKEQLLGITRELRVMKAESEGFADIGTIASGGGRIARKVSPIASAVGATIGQQEADVVRMSASMYDAAKAMPALTAKTVEFATKTASSTPLVSTLASGISAMVPALGAGAVATAAFLLPLAAIAAVVGAGILAINALNEAEKRRKEAAEVAAKAVAEQALAQATLDDKVNYALSGNAQARQQILNEYAEMSAKQENLWQEEAALREQLANATTKTQKKAYQAQLDLLYVSTKDQKAPYVELQQSMDLYKTALEKLNVTTQEAQAVGIAATFGANATKDALANLETQAKASAAEVDKLNTTLEQQTARVAQYEEQAATLRTNADAQTRKTQRNRDKAANRDLEDWLDERAKANSEHQKKITSIETEGNKKVASIRAEIKALPAQLTAQVKEVETKSTAAKAAANADYMASELKAVAKFHDDEARQTRDYNRQRMRDIEDWQSDLLDAEQANDVAQFKRIMRDGEKRLARQQEDQDTAVADRQTAFFEERDAARAALDAKLADIETSASEERTQLLATTEEKRVALRASLQEELAAIQQRKDAEIASFNESEANAQTARDKRLQRQQEDQDLADADAKEALDAQLLAIEIKRTAELQAIEQTKIAMLAMMNSVTSAAKAKTSTNAKASKPLNTSWFGSTTTTTGNNSRPYAFANEGYVTRPTVSLLGEKLRRGEGEAVVKFKLSEGLAPSILKRSGGGGGIQINAPFSINNPTFGDIPTGQEVAAMFEEYHTNLTNSLEKAVMTGRFNPQVN